MDYYINLILAEEIDALGELQGTSYYEKALDIANQGRFCRLPRWWDERYKDVQNLLSENHQPYRKMIAVFGNVLFHMDEGNEVEAKNVSKILIQLQQQIHNDDRERQYLEKFFNQSYKELLEIAKFQGDDSFFNVLMQLDPQHADYYKSNR